MMKRRFAAMAAAGAAAALVLTGCAGGGGGDNGDQPWTVAEDVTIEGSATFEAMQSAGQIVIGVKEDQPGLGYLDAATGERTGFDVDIARWMAAELGFGEDQIEFKAIPSANREQELVNGNIDMYVGTYSITDDRKEQIDFAGPYAITGQGLLVAADNDTLQSDADLTSDVSSARRRARLRSRTFARTMRPKLVSSTLTRSVLPRSRTAQSTQSPRTN